MSLIRWLLVRLIHSRLLLKLGFILFWLVIIHLAPSILLPRRYLFLHGPLLRAVARVPLAGGAHRLGKAVFAIFAHSRCELGFTHCRPRRVVVSAVTVVEGVCVYRTVSIAHARTASVRHSGAASLYPCKLLRLRFDGRRIVAHDRSGTHLLNSWLAHFSYVFVESSWHILRYLSLLLAPTYRLRRLILLPRGRPSCACTF